MDETEQELQCEGLSGRFSVFLMHAAILFRYTDGRCKTGEVIMPPAALTSTSAVAQLGALRSSMPSCLQNLACPAVTLLNTDSAKHQP